MRPLDEGNVYARECESTQGFLEDHPDSRSGPALVVAQAIMALAAEVRGLRNDLRERVV